MTRAQHEEVADAARQRLDELGRFWSAVDGVEHAPLAVSERGPATHRRGDLEDHRWVATWLRLREVAGLRAHHLGVVAAVALVAVAVTWWWASQRAPEAVEVADTVATSATFAASQTGDPAGSPTSGSIATPSPGPATGPDAPPSAGAVPDVVVVDVAGRVRRPQVVTLPAGSRVVDAIRKVGGARPGTDLSGINLARVLVDGEQILVSARPAARGPGAPASSSAAATAGASGVVNINTATQAELEQLPGVGPVTAQAILGWREAHGSFTRVEELLEVDGIGPKTLAKLAPLVTW